MWEALKKIGYKVWEGVKAVARWVWPFAKKAASEIDQQIDKIWADAEKRVEAVQAAHEQKTRDANVQSDLETLKRVLADYQRLKALEAVDANMKSKFFDALAGATGSSGPTGPGA